MVPSTVAVIYTYIPTLLTLLYVSVPKLAENKIEAGTDPGNLPVPDPPDQSQIFLLGPTYILCRHISFHLEPYLCYIKLP